MNWSEMVRRMCRVINYVAVLVAAVGLIAGAAEVIEKWPDDHRVGVYLPVYGRNAESIEKAVENTRRQLRLDATKDAVSYASAGLAVAAVLATVSWIVSGLASSRQP